MSSKGRRIYVPSSVLDEIDSIKRNNNIEGEKSKSVALREMVKYSKIGRGVESMYNTLTLGTYGIAKKVSKRKK